MLLVGVNISFLSLISRLLPVCLKIQFGEELLS